LGRARPSQENTSSPSADLRAAAPLPAFSIPAHHYRQVRYLPLTPVMSGCFAGRAKPPAVLRDVDHRSRWQYCATLPQARRLQEGYRAPCPARRFTLAATCSKHRLSPRRAIPVIDKASAGGSAEAPPLAAPRHPVPRGPRPAGASSLPACIHCAILMVHKCAHERRSPRARDHKHGAPHPRGAAPVRVWFLLASTPKPPPGRRGRSAPRPTPPPGAPGSGSADTRRR